MVPLVEIISSFRSMFEISFELTLISKFVNLRCRQQPVCDIRYVAYKFISKIELGLKFWLVSKKSGSFESMASSSGQSDFSLIVMDLLFQLKIVITRNVMAITAPTIFKINRII